MHPLTENAHDVTTFTDLVLARVVALLKRRLLLVVYEHGARVHRVGNFFQALHVLARNPLDHPSSEARSTYLHYMGQQQAD